MSATAPSGWCSPCKPGDNAHAICEDRVNRGLLSCACPGHAKATADTPQPASKRGYW